jgi:hypothetical protein
MLELTMRLDHTQLEKVKGYYVYRSEESEGDRPVVDGLYVQRQAIGDRAPESMRVSIGWD